MIDEAPLSVPAIVVYSKATGAILYRGPKTAPIPSADYSWTPLPTGYDEATHSWNAAMRTMAEDAAKVEALLVAKVKALAATKKMAAMSSGTAKTEEYRLKAPEIAASANIVAGVLNGLTAANAMLQYPAAATEARLSGEPLATVLGRFRAGANASNPEVNRLSAIEQVQCRRIVAATTGAAKRAAYAAINWDWKP